MVSLRAGPLCALGETVRVCRLLSRLGSSVPGVDSVCGGVAPFVGGVVSFVSGVVSVRWWCGFRSLVVCRPTGLSSSS